MANKRGRGRGEMGQAFSPYMISGGSSPTPGQPVMIRTQGIPTGPGYKDRPGKWNVLLPPLVAWIVNRILDVIRM